MKTITAIRSIVDFRRTADAFIIGDTDVMLLRIAIDFGLQQVTLLFLSLTGVDLLSIPPPH